MKAKEAREARQPAVADVERILRVIDDQSVTPEEKMDWLTTSEAVPGSVQRRIACRIARWIERRIARWTPIAVDDPLAVEAVRLAERHSLGHADDEELKEVRERTRRATWGRKHASSLRLRKRIRGMAWLAAAATADAEPEVALEKTARIAREVDRAIEIIREAERIGGAATGDEVREAYVRACVVSEAMLEVQLEIARQVIQEWFEG